MPYMRRSLNCNTCYVNKWTGEKVPVFSSAYLLNIVFPSKSRSVPVLFRSALRDFFSYYNDLCHMFPGNQFNSIARDFRFKFHRYCFLPLVGKFDSSLSWDEIHFRLHDLRSKIDSFADKLPDIDLVDKLDRLRSVYQARLYSFKPVPDVLERAYVVRKKFNRSLATQIL